MVESMDASALAMAHAETMDYYSITPISLTIPDATWTLTHATPILFWSVLYVMDLVANDSAPLHHRRSNNVEK